MPLFRSSPTKKLEKAYQRKMESAMRALRQGDVRLNAQLVSEAEEIKRQIDSLS